MKNLKSILIEGLADWDEGDFEKSIKKETSKSAIKKLIIDYIFTNYSRESYIDKKIYKNKIKIDTSTTPWTVDYDGDLYLKTWLKDELRLTNGMFQWGEIMGCFDISFSKIDSLDGCPKKTRKFKCSNCPNLKSLEGGPKDVGISYYCFSCNNLESLKGAPKIINGLFNCSNCPNLKSLEGGPEKLFGEFDNGAFTCQLCGNLKDLKGAPKIVDSFDCVGCKNLTSLKGSPKKVKSFYCNNCKSLKSLEGGPEEVISFNCKECDGIKDLKGVPSKIKSLYCMKCNNLESLEGLPKDQMNILYCSYTPITSLDGVPDKINTIDITGCNKLKRWGDNGPKEIIEIRCAVYDKNIRDFLDRKDDPNYPKIIIK